MTELPPASPPRRLTYASLGISLGLAGAGSAWGLAAVRFGIAPIPSEILFGASALCWVIVVAARLPFTVARFRQLLADLQHPVSGPFPAYVPIIALLLTSHYAPLAPPAIAQFAVVSWTAALTLLCAQMLSSWLSGRLRSDDLHPGYALPVIAGPFIAAMALSSIGYDRAGVAAAAVGGFYWLALGGAIFIRLLHGAPLAPPLRPTLAVLVTPPVTAGLAWFALRGGAIDTAQVGLAGIVTLFLAVQLFLLPTALRGPFHTGYWAFSFPAGALASYALRWAVASPGTVTDVLAVLALATASIVLLTLAVASVAGAIRARPTVRR